MNNLVTKSSLSTAQISLVEIFRDHPYCRVEGLKVQAGEPLFAPPPTIIQKVKLGSDESVRPELGPGDFCLKKQTIELLKTIAELGEGEIRSIAVQHGLPITIEIERGWSST
jgi:hypothetical protein